jgi:phospholipid-binding lipoprotein MlaA
VKHSTFSALALLVCLSGCAISGKRPAAKPDSTATSAVGEDFANVPAQKTTDPLERLNRTVFVFNDGLYTYALRPFAHGYAFIVPLPVRTGIKNFFDNVEYPVRFINCVLQGKLTRSAQETGKFVINSTAGVGGLIRVSDHISGLADVPAEDFGQTLAVWGFPSGPYLVIPVLGPSDFRDAVGLAGDFVMSPLNWHTIGLIHYEYISDALGIALGAVHYVNALPQSIKTYDEMKSAAVDPYIALRDAFLSYRAAQVKK